MDRQSPKLLLIQPRGSESVWDLHWLTHHLLPGRRHVNAPLGLATVAALTPPNWNIQIVDEHIDMIPYVTDADIVGITGTNLEYERQTDLLAHYRRQGKHTVAGGPYVSLVPELYHGKADTLVLGEAEYTWPAFCRQWPTVAPIYKEFGEVDLTHSPIPRFDLLDLDRYLFAGVQFSRGCPYRCEFCDAIQIFGRKPRVKSISQIHDELLFLEHHGAEAVFFVDDNLIGNRPAARELMDVLAWQQFNMVFGCEASLNLARDPRMMHMMRAANFEWIFTGIETPDVEALKAVKKYQNLGMPPLDAVRTIYQHGLQIYAGFIVGFDEDDTTVFDRQYDFIMESGIAMAMVSLLFAMPKTPLYDRLKRDDRIVDDYRRGFENTQSTNIVPKKMTREELVDGHRWLYTRLFAPEAIAARISQKRQHLKDPVVFNQWNDFGAARRLRQALPWWAKPRNRIEAKDWSIGLNLQDYVMRHLHGSDVSRTVQLQR